MRRTVLGAMVVLLAAGCLLPALQRTIGVATFEWGTLKTFKGVLEPKPYPHLLVQRPGRNAGFSAYYLVAPFKFGLESNSVAAFAGKEVTLKGTLIYRGNQTMIEARPDSIKPAGTPGTGNARAPVLSLGRQTLVGEIVDSKCYLGVMNPGRFTPHRACAVRCISGGIPPVLLVQSEAGPPLFLLLVSSDGAPVNKQVLDMVAEPVEITGEVQREGELLVLRADPRSYRRLRN